MTCICIPVDNIFPALERFFIFLMSSPIFTFGLGFAAGVMLCVWLSAWLPSYFDNKEKRKND